MFLVLSFPLNLCLVFCFRIASARKSFQNRKQESVTQVDVGKGKESELAINELIKGEDLQFKFAKLEKGESSDVKKKPNEGEKYDCIFHCIWCDNTQHLKGDCQSLKDALETNIIFYHNGRINT